MSLHKVLVARVWGSFPRTGAKSFAARKKTCFSFSSCGVAVRQHPNRNNRKEKGFISVHDSRLLSTAVGKSREQELATTGHIMPATTGHITPAIRRGEQCVHFYHLSPLPTHTAWTSPRGVFPPAVQKTCDGLSENVPHGLRHLDTWFLVGGAAWGGLRGCPWWRKWEGCHWRRV